MTIDQSNRRAAILYVDDDRENLIGFKAVFRREYDVHIAESAREALEILEQIPIQVLITDQRMPEMSGSEMLVKVGGRYPNMLRFILTGFSDFDPLVGALNEGRLQGYFSKPLDVPKVKKRIEEGLAKYFLKIENEELNESLRKRERQVRLQLAELEQIYAAAPVGLILVDRDYRVIRINEILAEIDGLSVEDHLGKTLDEILPELAGKLKEIYQPVLETGDPVVNIAIHGSTPKAPGVVRDWLCSYFPFKKDNGEILGVIGGVIEVTDLKQAEKKAEKARLFSHKLLETANAMIVNLDRDGNVVLVNPMVEKVTGFTSGELIGSNWCEKVVPKGRYHQVWKDCAKNVAGGVAHRFENPIRTKSGEERIISWNISKLSEGGVFAGTLSVGIDITQRKAAEEEKNLLAAQLRQAQKMEAIGTLAGGIAHDFNNILSPIIGYAEIIREDSDPESDCAANAEEILTAGIRARELVYQILTFSREKEQEKKPFKIHPVLKEALKLLRASLPTTIELTHSIDKNCGPIFGDPTQIYQVVMNLCTNAYQAMLDQGRGRIEFAAEEVLLTDDDQPQFIDLKPGPHVLVSVRDTGPGIEPAIMERIFDPYFTTKRMESGTGLGLSVVHGIVKGHSGAIKVYSEAGQGTVINVYFPRMADRKADSAIKSPASIAGGSESLLLVDDEAPIVALMKRILGNLGYRADGFTDARQALAAFEENPDDYDLIISDMTMPNLSGLELAQAVQSIRADMPIVICTGFSEMMSREKLAEAGVRNVIIKPVLKDELARTVRKALENGPH